MSQPPSRPRSGRAVSLGLTNRQARHGHLSGQSRARSGRPRALAGIEEPVEQGTHHPGAGARAVPHPPPGRGRRHATPAAPARQRRRGARRRPRRHHLPLPHGLAGLPAGRAGTHRHRAHEAAPRGRAGRGAAPPGCTYRVPRERRLPAAAHRRGPAHRPAPPRGARRRQQPVHHGAAAGGAHPARRAGARAAGPARLALLHPHDAGPDAAFRRAPPLGRPTHRRAPCHLPAAPLHRRGRLVGGIVLLRHGCAESPGRAGDRPPACRQRAGRQRRSRAGPPFWRQPRVYG